MQGVVSSALRPQSIDPAILSLIPHFGRSLDALSLTHASPLQLSGPQAVQDGIKLCHVNPVWRGGLATTWLLVPTLPTRTVSSTRLWQPDQTMTLFTPLEASECKMPSPAKRSRKACLVLASLLPLLHLSSPRPSQALPPDSLPDLVVSCSRHLHVPLATQNIPAKPSVRPDLDTCNPYPSPLLASNFSRAMCETPKSKMPPASNYSKDARLAPNAAFFSFTCAFSTHQSLSSLAP